MRELVTIQAGSSFSLLLPRKACKLIELPLFRSSWKPSRYSVLGDDLAGTWID